MKKIVVVNKYKHNNDISLNNIYIGRGSFLGNPFTHLEGESLALYKVQTRAEAIQEYEKYLLKKIEEKDENIINELNSMIDKVQLNNIYLICFCKPLRCHGDVIKKILKEKIKSGERF